MADKMTEAELELAKRVNDLRDAVERPAVAGGGFFAQAANFLMRRVSRGMITAALTVFVAYHGWETFNGSLQAMADLQNKRAEAGAAIAEANAQNSKAGSTTIAVANMQAEIDRLQQQAAATQAEADAQNTTIGDSTVKLQTIRAEIAKTNAEAQMAQIEADAQTQLVNGMPAAIAQKKAEVETAEASLQVKIAAKFGFMQNSIRIANDPVFNALGGGR